MRKARRTTAAMDKPIRAPILKREELKNQITLTLRKKNAIVLNTIKKQLHINALLS